MKKSITILGMAALFATSAYAQSERPRVIYGADNRIELYQAGPAWQKKADSTVALVEKYDLQQLDDGRYKLGGTNYGDYFNLCPDEPFREQKTLAFCSGSLVAPNVIMTAGHCVRTQSSCENTKFVFGFSYYKKGESLDYLSAAEVYSCKKLIAREEHSRGADYALVELDRPVVGHAPLELRKSGVAAVGDSMVVIGHPSGIPTKLAGGANVRSIHDGYFMANLDTYGGNSGSAVLNEKTGLVEGILVRGETDFVQVNGCTKSNICPNDGCRGEDVTRIDAVINHLPH